MRSVQYKVRVKSFILLNPAKLKIAFYSFMLSVTHHSYICRMAEEMENNDLRGQFESILQAGDVVELRRFLDDQNISDVAELVHEYEEQETVIITCMAVH